MSRLLFLFCGLLAACTSPPADPQARFASMTARLDKILAPQPGAPGVAVVVIKDGFPPYLRATGAADLARQRGLTTDTVMPIFSVTKPLTALAILQLEEAGRLRTDDTVARWLPGLPAAWGAVTVHQLLSHQSGLPNYLWGVNTAAVRKLDGVDNDALLLTFPADARLTFAPGSRTAYCNTNYLLLAQIVAKASGRSYAQYLRQHIFSPLDMRHSYVTGETPPFDVQPGLNYGRSEKTIGVTFATVGAMGVHSSAHDLARLGSALRAGRVVSMPTLARMTRPQSRHPITGTTEFYGYGWFMQHDAAPASLFAHHGGADGYRHVLRVNHAWGVSYVVLGNGGDASDKLARSVMRVVQDVYERPDR